MCALRSGFVVGGVPARLPPVVLLPAPTRPAARRRLSASISIITSASAAVLSSQWVYWSAGTCGFTCHVIALRRLPVRRSWPKGPHSARKLRRTCVPGCRKMRRYQQMVVCRNRLQLVHYTLVRWLQTNDSWCTLPRKSTTFR